MGQDVTVVCDGKGVPVDSQLETQNETHEESSFFPTKSKKQKQKQKKKEHFTKCEVFKARAQEQLIIPYVLG